MVAVLTGDIINSRTEPAPKWLASLKEALHFYGSSPSDWEIFRGDSFQLCVPPEKAIQAALHLKSGIRQIKGLDIRIGIGIGEQEYRAAHISESNGSAFIRSGECFESLNRQNLAILTGNPEFDDMFNLLLSWALLTMNTWSVTVSKAIKISLEHPEKSQTQLAHLIKKSQSTLSEALTRGAYEEVQKLDTFYRKQIKTL